MALRPAVAYLHLSLLFGALNAQLGKFASPHCPLPAAMVMRAVAGGLADATAKDPAFAFTANFTRPGEMANLSRMTTLEIPPGGVGLLFQYIQMVPW